MLTYSAILLVTAAIFLGLSIAIYRGKTNLIHDYHQTGVTDKVGYGKAMGKALLVMTAAMLLSGIVGLFGDSDGIALLAVAVLVVGFVIGLVCIAVVQKKFNGEGL